MINSLSLKIGDIVYFKNVEIIYKSKVLDIVKDEILGNVDTYIRPFCIVNLVDNKWVDRLYVDGRDFLFYRKYKKPFIKNLHISPHYFHGVICRNK